MLAPSLYHFFRRQIQHALSEKNLGEPETVEYISDVLTRFARTPALFAVRDEEGRPLEHIALMLAEWQRAQGMETAAPDRPRQALIMRHVGEYTLFMSGLFRERLEARGQLGYYLDNGRSAYWQSADFEPNPKRARVFRRLYFDMDRVSDALDHIRRERLPLDPSPETPVVSLWRM